MVCWLVHGLAALDRHLCGVAVGQATAVVNDGATQRQRNDGMTKRRHPWCAGVGGTFSHTACLGKGSPEEVTGGAKGEAASRGEADFARQRLDTGEQRATVGRAPSLQHGMVTCHGMMAARIEVLHHAAARCKQDTRPSRARGFTAPAAPPEVRGCGRGCGATAWVRLQSRPGKQGRADNQCAPTSVTHANTTRFACPSVCVSKDALA